MNGKGRERGRAAEARQQRSFRWLITAALADGPDALQAWKLWLAEFELDTLQGDGYWILPLLSRNLARAGGEYGERQRLAGVYKQMRLRNALLQPQIEDLIHQLSERKCDVLPGAITSLVLGGEDAIPLDPVELLVPMASLEAANSLLLSGGWNASLPLPPRLLRPFVSSLRYRREKAGELILSWRPFGLDCPLEQDDSLWQGAVPGQSSARAIRMAKPVDRLLMALQKDSFLQVSVLANRCAPQVSEQTLTDRAAELDLTSPLPRLAEFAGPGASSKAPGARQPAEHSQPFAEPDATAPLFTLARRHWRRYRRCPESLRPAGFLAYLRGYYCYTWQAPTSFRLVANALNRAGSRLIRRRKQGAVI